MYGALAKYYDLFMKDVAYERWIPYAAEKIGMRKTGVDFGCGTGRFTLGLSALGYRVTGVDSSAEMLNEATAAAVRQGVSVPFVLGDIRTFTPPHTVDFALAMCDTVNYLPRPLAAFKNVYRNLKKGGVFLFDLSSAYKLRTILAGKTYSETEDDITYIWRNVGYKNRVEMELTFFEPTDGGLYKKSTESQIQYIHETIIVNALLAEAGFKEIGCFGRFSDKKPKDNETRIHFLAKKL